jgi:uncharacterized protein DUF4132
VDAWDEDLATRLAALHERLDVPPGVMAGVLRLPILDPILEELEVLQRDAPGRVSPAVLVELGRLAELLTTGMLGTAAEAVPRRARVIELLRVADGGRLPPIVADLGDPFGEELASMLESDEELRTALGRLHPLAMRASSVTPNARWLGEARKLADGPEGPRLAAATRRVLATLLRAPIDSRPDILVGGVRLTNQRLARGVLWFAAAALPNPAETLGAVGLRMGTSGRRDAVVRDTALANTAAALLGASEDPAAPAALASMRSRVTNRNVLKQVERALTGLAQRRRTSVEDLVDASLPTFGLDADGRREIDVAGGAAVVAVGPSGEVATTWRLADGRDSATPPPVAEADDPAGLAEVAVEVAAIAAGLAEEVARLEGRLGSTRAWPLETWRARFADHPVARPFARRLVWLLDLDGSTRRSVLPDGDGWIGWDGRSPPDLPDSAHIRLWHPAEAGEAEVAAWRATLAARAMTQPFRQVDRDAFIAAPEPAPPSADVRFAGRTVDHAQLRALLRSRGWAVPALGAWDQGDEATGWRAFDGDLRAEIRYQAPERGRSGERIDRARIVAVRFVRTPAPPASRATGEVLVPVADVPKRSFSEALRDVSLAVVVGEAPLPG